MTKCLSCGYLHYDTRLNCSKCGSFYTEIFNDVIPKKIEDETIDTMTQIKQEKSIEVHHD